MIDVNKLFLFKYNKYVLESDIPVIVHKSEEEMKHESQMRILRIMSGMCGLKYSS
jgi:hypothetical protein